MAWRRAVAKIEMPASTGPSVTTVQKARNRLNAFRTRRIFQRVLTARSSAEKSPIAVMTRNPPPITPSPVELERLRAIRERISSPARLAASGRPCSMYASSTSLTSTSKSRPKVPISAKNRIPSGTSERSVE
jgi:hypothetical protein